MSDEKKDEQSATYRAKKFWASKTVGTRAGRKVITSLLGEDGELLLKALKRATTKFADEAKSKEVKKDILKLAIKAKLCADEGRLTEKNTAHAAQPINSLSVQMLRHLQQAPGTVDVSSLAGNFSRIRDLIVDIMQPHLKPKNLEKLVSVFKFIGDPKFLNDILNNEKYAEERNAFKEHLGNVLTPLVQSLELGKSMISGGACKVHNCKFPRAEAKGAFRGSEYCPRHHLVHLEAQLQKPVLEHFIDPADFSSSFFIQFLADFSRKTRDDESKGDPSIDIPMYHFYDAVAKYKTVGRNLRKPRAELIFQKYLKDQRSRGSIFVSSSKELLPNLAILGPNSSSASPAPKDLTVKLDDVILKKIQDDLFLSDAQSSSLATLFDEAQAVARTRLDQCFEGFLKSPYFKQYAASVSLPPELAAQARELAASVSSASVGDSKSN